MENFKTFDESFDFGSFIHYPEENMNMESADFQLPAMDTSADALDFSDMPLFPEMDSLTDADFNLFDPLEYPACDLANDTPFTAEPQPLAPQAEDFRYVVDSWASADHRLRSTKQKRRDAAIDLHLQRFMNSHADPQSFSIDSDVSPSNTPSITYSQGSSQQSPVESTPTSSTSSDNSTAPPAGGCEFIFDMNLNTATKLPKKQKKRTQSQIKDYINVRRNGACVKHKKQHKKCNCHEKLSAKAGVDVTKRRAAAANKPVLTPELILNNTPSTLSISSFSQSPLSQLDNVSYGDEIDTALASLEDFASLDTVSEMPVHEPISQQHYIQRETSGFMSNTRQRAVTSQSTARYLNNSPAQDTMSNELLPAGLSNVSDARFESARVETASERALQRNASGNLQTSGPSDVGLDPSDHSPARVLQHSPSHHNSSNLEHGTPAGLPVGQPAGASRAGALQARVLRELAVLPTSSPLVQSSTTALPASSVSPVSPLLSESSVSSAPVSPLLEAIRTQPRLQVSPSARAPAPMAILRTLSEIQTADLSNPDVKKALQAIYSAAVQQNNGDPTALLSAVECISWLSSMALQTIQSILTLRPNLFQLLPEKVPCPAKMLPCMPCMPSLPFCSAARQPQAIAGCA